MKIAILGSKNFDSLEFHLNDSLNFLGHEVFHFDVHEIIPIPYYFNYWANKLSTKYNQFIFKQIALKIIEVKPDLVICTYRFIHPDCIKKMKEELRSSVIVHINPDQLTTFEHQQIFASPYDAYFSKDQFIVSFMKNKMRLNTFYLPEAFNPRVHKVPNVERSALEEHLNIDVVTFGTMYPYRAKMVQELINEGINIQLFGIPDKRFPQEKISKAFKNEYITGNKKAEILYGSKIVFNNFHYAEIESVNVKFFEIAGIGGFQICDYKPAIKEYSKIPIETFTYKSIDEAISLLKYYLANKEERYKLAEQQRLHFNEFHTYEVRMTEMMSQLSML